MYLEFSYPIDSAKPIMNTQINPPRVIPRTRMAEGDKSNTSYFEMYAHTSTHIDSPWHFNPKGRKINDFGIDQFVFDQVSLLNIPKESWQTVEYQDLEPYQERISQSNALLINTGFGKKYRSSEPEVYLTATPGLSLDAAKFLASMPNLHCVGVDFTSIENLQHNRALGYPVHHALLDRAEPIILLEDACLELLNSKPIKRIFLFPLRIVDVEASPVTAVAEI